MTCPAAAKLNSQVNKKPYCSTCMEESYDHYILHTTHHYTPSVHSYGACDYRRARYCDDCCENPPQFSRSSEEDACGYRRRGDDNEGGRRKGSEIW